MELQRQIAEVVPSKPEEYAYYLFCLFPGVSLLFSEKGIEEDSKAFIVSHEEIGALVSPVSLHTFNSKIRDGEIQDLEFLIPLIKRHDNLVKVVMSIYPVIPVKFGTIYKDLEKVRELLRKGYDEFRGFLSFITDKEEWGVKVYVDEKVCCRKIEDSSDLLKELRSKNQSASPGKAFFLKKKFEDSMRAELSRCLNDRAEKIFKQILPLAVDAKRTKLLTKNVTGKDMGMVLNSAFLLSKAEIEKFKVQIDNLAAFYTPYGLFFERSGPWPAYNFCPGFKVFDEGNPK